MDTLPMPLDELAAAHGGLADFRVTQPSEIKAMLKQLADAAITLNLNGPDGSAVTATLWTIDSSRNVLSFSADPNGPQLRSLIECDEAVVVGYLDNIKVQFDVQHLVLVHGASGAALNCSFPRELYRFQRRNSFRVKPLLRSSPVALLRHPMIPDMQLNLRVLDVSIGGCALFLPDDVPPLTPGVTSNGVHIELDAETRLDVCLRIQHVAVLGPEARGMRLGCEMINPTANAVRSLQRYIDQTQKRRRFMVLE